MRICGVDGCKRGWVAVWNSGPDRFSLQVFATFEELAAARWDVIAVDIPIGIEDSWPRSADEEARAVLGWPRRNSVFPAPIRSALRACTRESASKITRRIVGKGVGAQAWGIFPKVRQVDDVLRQAPDLHRITFEVHPEVSFWAMNDRRAMTAKKSSSDGWKERHRLLCLAFGPDYFEQVRGIEPRKTWVADDDILDAFAALWTAERIARGESRTLPEEPPHDASGNLIAIHY